MPELLWVPLISRNRAVAAMRTKQWQHPDRDVRWPRGLTGLEWWWKSATQVIPFDARSCGGVRCSDRLLVVDRQLAFVHFARLIARRMGYETGVVLDSRELAARVRNWQPTVLIIEVELPEVDGIEMIGALSELGFEGDLILVTAHDPRSLALAQKTAEARGLRVATCLQKPVRTADMILALELCTRTAAHRA